MPRTIHWLAVLEQPKVEVPGADQCPGYGALPGSLAHVRRENHAVPATFESDLRIVQNPRDPNSC